MHHNLLPVKNYVNAILASLTAQELAHPAKVCVFLVVMQVHSVQAARRTQVLTRALGPAAVFLDTFIMMLLAHVT